MRRTRQRFGRLLLLIGLAPAAAIFFFACGYGGGGYGAGGTSVAGTTTVTGNSASVSMKNIAFNPADITVSKGTKVTWANNDNVAHTVTASDGMFDSGNVNPGKSFSFTFNQAGTFPYYCRYHVSLGMKGEVTVK